MGMIVRGNANLSALANVRHRVWMTLTTPVTLLSHLLVEVLSNEPRMEMS